MKQADDKPLNKIVWHFLKKKRKEKKGTANHLAGAIAKR